MREEPCVQLLFSTSRIQKFVDPNISRKMQEKMQETMDRGAEIRAMADRLSPDATEDFVAGVIAGRLYNSFHYQCRRIKKRNPEPREVDEFLDMVAGRWSQMVTACSRPN